MLVHCRRPAMATWFEACLSGDDPEHLAAVGEALLDEVARVERLLSRFDPASEVSRVNREAAARPVLVDHELFAILCDCWQWNELTDESFDVRVPLHGPRLRYCEVVRLDDSARTVRFTEAGTALDFGGYGKGYALAQAATILREFGVASALVHGGTSSVLAWGRGDDGRPWRVGVRDPFAADLDTELLQLPLADCGLSSSAVSGPGTGESDLVDPRAGRRLTEPAACVVLTPSALDAEVLSTALLAMGRERARSFARERLPADHAVGWIERGPDGPRLEWFAGQAPTE
jgi:thiamine biosynthesis lipoprotein